MPVYTLPELPYDYSALAPVTSPEIIELHHDRHHAAYVKGANDSLDPLADHDRPEGRRGRSPGRRRRGRTRAAITESFGSFAGFKSQLTKAAATTQGSGWDVLAHEHAFYLQYKNQKVDFIDAMWAVVNWQDVARRYAAAKERGDSLLPAP
ncbi:superoxide dismutase [Streptomyces guryensis]|uniref:superoxide dismutase n=1 Tax=Streptomyces guryensis TaxID=2886947 RepID=UPI0022B79767|nr:superoxide dismutase [Streptomyces guryensis]